MSKSRSETSKEFSSKNVAITRQKHAFYRLSILPITTQDCRDFKINGQCRSTISRQKLLDSFAGAVDSLPDIKYMEAAHIGKLTADEVQGNKWFCYETPANGDALPQVECKQRSTLSVQAPLGPQAAPIPVGNPVPGDQAGLLIFGNIEIEEAIRKYARAAYAFRRFVWRYGTHYI